MALEQPEWRRGNSMAKVFPALLVVAFLTTSYAHADQRTKIVPAGKTSIVSVYTAWDPTYCGSVHGVVKVAAKPQHGRLSNKLIDTTIGYSRFGAVGQCYGKPTKGFAVLYTPERGYRGSDSFSFDISWPVINRQANDTFAITVQ